MKKYYTLHIYDSKTCETTQTELPPNGTWLTREEVEAAWLKVYNWDVEDCKEVLDTLFGEKP